MNKKYHSTLTIILLFIIIIGVILSDIYCIDKNKHQKQKLFNLGSEIKYHEFSNNKDFIEGMEDFDTSDTSTNITSSVKGCPWWAGHLPSLIHIKRDTTGNAHCEAIKKHKEACEWLSLEQSMDISGGCKYKGSGKHLYDKYCKDRLFECSIITPMNIGMTQLTRDYQEQNKILKENLETTSNAFKRCINDMMTIDDTAQLKYVTGPEGTSRILAQSIWWGDKDMDGTENMVAINNIAATTEEPEWKNIYARYDFPSFHDYLDGTYLDVSSLLAEVKDEFISLTDTDLPNKNN